MHGVGVWYGVEQIFTMPVNLQLTPSQNPPFPSFLTGATSASASRVGRYGAIQMLYYYYYYYSNVEFSIHALHCLTSCKRLKTAMYVISDVQL